MTTLHETHVCRDCGAEITLPYATPPSESAPLSHGFSPRPIWASTCPRCGAAAGTDCAVLATPPSEEATGLTREEAVEKALLYVFQLSGKDYRKMQTAMSEVAFIRALEQDGYTVARLTASDGGRE